MWTCLWSPGDPYGTDATDTPTNSWLWNNFASCLLPISKCKTHQQFVTTCNSLQSNTCTIPWGFRINTIEATSTIANLWSYFETITPTLGINFVAGINWHACGLRNTTGDVSNIWNDTSQLKKQVYLVARAVEVRKDLEHVRTIYSCKSKVLKRNIQES